MAHWASQWAVLVILGFAASGVVGQTPLERWSRDTGQGLVTTLSSEAVAAATDGLPPAGSGDGPTRRPPPPGSEWGSFRGLWVVQAAPADLSWPDRLKRGLEPRAAELLFHGDDQGEAAEDALNMLIEAARVLRDGRAGAPAEATLAQACYWLAAQDMDQVLRLADGVARGTGYLRYNLDLPTRPGRAPLPLAVWFAVPGPDHRGWDIMLSFHARGHDDFADLLAEVHGTTPLPEFRERMLAKARETDLPFGGDAALNQAVRVSLAARPLKEVLATLAQTAKVELAASPEVAEEAVTAVLAGQSLRDALLALARVTGAVLEKQGPGYRLRPAGTVRERLEQNLPTRWWADLQRTRPEATVVKMTTREALWERLPKDLLERARRTPPLLSELPAPARAALDRLLELRLARTNLWRVTASLPAADGRAPLKLFRAPAPKHRWALAGPGGSVVLSGHAAAVLEADRQPWLPVRLMKKEEAK